MKKLETDPVPFAASMVPLIKSLAGKVSLSIVGMALIIAFGTDVGGSMTPIGASPITILEIVLAGISFVIFYH